jgi:kynurenine formamidase
MRIRSFIIAYSLVLAILLFADRRPGPAQQDRYSHVVDLTDAPKNNTALLENPGGAGTRIIAPAALIPGTWTASQIPAERLIAPLVVMDLKASSNQSSQITLDEIAVWESSHGVVPQGAVVAIRRMNAADLTPSASLPITAGAAQFLMDARYVLGFAVDAPANLASDRALSRQLALHGDYVVAGAARLWTLPATGSLVIVAPAKNKNAAEGSVRILAMVR